MSAYKYTELNVSLVPTMATPNRFDSLRQDALELSESDRATLARDLVASLDGPEDPDVAKAWNIELCRRINEIETGKAKLIDADEVLARARERLKNI